MTVQRIIAAIAAILTALLLQATIVSPLAVSTPVSLPAVLVVAIALTSGAGAGISVGFSAGLLADLGSAHPVGVLALAWMVLAIATAAIAEMLSGRRAKIVLTALACTVTAAIVVLLLTVVGSSGATASVALTSIVPTFAGDLLLASVTIPVVSAILRSESLHRVGASTVVMSPLLSRSRHQRRAR